MSILVVMEQRAGRGTHVVGDTGGGQQLGQELQQPVRAAVLGQQMEGLAAEFGKQLDRVYVVEHELLKDYTPDGYTAALRQLVEQLGRAW